MNGVAEVWPEAPVEFAVGEIEERLHRLRIHQVHEPTVKAHRRFEIELDDDPIPGDGLPFDLSRFRWCGQELQALPVDPILAQPASCDHGLELGRSGNCDLFWTLDHFRLVAQAPHPVFRLSRQYLALVVTGHPDVACFAGGPVVFVDEVEFEAATLGLLEAGANALPPFLGMVRSHKAVPRM